MSVKRGDRPGFHNHSILSERFLAGIPATLVVAPPSIRDRPRIAIGHMFAHWASTPFCITFQGPIFRPCAPVNSGSISLTPARVENKGLFGSRRRWITLRDHQSDTKWALT